MTSLARHATPARPTRSRNNVPPTKDLMDSCKPISAVDTAAAPPRANCCCAASSQMLSRYADVVGWERFIMAGRIMVHNRRSDQDETRTTANLWRSIIKIHVRIAAGPLELDQVSSVVEHAQTGSLTSHRSSRVNHIQKI